VQILVVCDVGVSLQKLVDPALGVLRLGEFGGDVDAPMGKALVQSLNPFRNAGLARVDLLAAADQADEPGADIPALARRITAKNAKIDRLAASLAEAENSSARRYIVAEIERQDLNLAALKRELELAKAEKRKADLKGRSLDAKAQEIGNLVRAFDSLPAADRNGIVREVVQECTWDGETLFLRL
jgi:hypothetical protein